MEVPLNAPSAVDVGETLLLALYWCLYPHKVSPREKTVLIEQERKNKSIAIETLLINNKIMEGDKQYPQLSSPKPALIISTYLVTKLCLVFLKP